MDLKHSLAGITQLPYHRLNPSDFIYELAPKKIGNSYKVPMPDKLKELLGDNFSLAFPSHTDSFWHCLLYAVLPHKYHNINWHFKKQLVQNLVEALDEKLNVYLATNNMLKYSTFKLDNVNLREDTYSHFALIYTSIVFNISIVVYNGTNFEFFLPEEEYESPVLVLYYNRVFSVCCEEGQSLFNSNSDILNKFSKYIPKKHIIADYLSSKCPVELKGKLQGLSSSEIAINLKRQELQKLKAVELKELYFRLSDSKSNLESNLESKSKARLTKEVMITKILELV